VRQKVSISTHYLKSADFLTLMIQYLWWGKTQATAPKFNNGRIQVHEYRNSQGKTFMSHAWKHIFYATLQENVYIHMNNLTPKKWALQLYKRHYAAPIKTILSALLHRWFNRCYMSPFRLHNVYRNYVISKMKQQKQHSGDKTMHHQADLKIQSTVTM
jgi:hypothetical protein